MSTDDVPGALDYDVAEGVNAQPTGVVAIICAAVLLGLIAGVALGLGVAP